jgi:hypothetical protein
MCAAWVSSSVRLPDFAGTTTFHRTLALAGAFVLCTLVLFGFVYWQTAAGMRSTIDGLLTNALRHRSKSTDHRTIDFIEFVRALAVDAARRDHERGKGHGKDLVRESLS